MVLPNEPTRRALLVAFGSLGAGLVAGCTGSGSGSEHTDADRVDDFYLENYDDEATVFDLSLQRRGADEPVVDGRYEVPASTAAVFSEVGAEGAVYDVHAVLEDGRELRAEWSVDECTVLEGDRHGGVVLTIDDDLVYRQNDCDVVHLGDDVDTVAPAGRFRIQTTATPTRRESP